MEKGGWQNLHECVELGGREWGFSMRRGSPLWIFRGCCWSGVEGRKRGRGISAAEGREMVEGGGVGGGGVGVVVE